MANPENNVPPTPKESGSGCLLRLCWMVFGNAVLGVCAIVILNRRGTYLGSADAVFWATVLVLVWLRHFDITHMHGRTGEGLPASLSDWKRYVVILLPASVLVWAAAHAVVWIT